MSLLICFFEIFLALCGFIVLWRNLRGKKSKKRRIKNWPVVGMLPEIILNINSVHDGFTELHDRCGGTFLFKVPWFEMLTTTDPANIQHIMTTSFSNYPKGPEFKKIFDVVGNGFSNADDDLWRNHRRVARQLLTHNKFYQFLLSTTYDKVQNGLIPLLDHVSKQGLVVDLQDVFIRLTFDATCILVTGQDPGSLSVGFPDAPFPRALIDAEEAIFYRHAMPEKTWKLMRFLGIGKEKKLSKAVETLDNLICKCISTKRRENNGESIDLLTSYMDQDNTQGWEIDDKLLRDTILNLMIAGQDTTASALTWFFWLLSENPSVETKIREELETTEPESDIEKLNKLVYLHAALCESLRLYPPVPFQLKTPLKSDILPSGHKVEPNTKVMLLTYSMGRMKRVWGKDCLEYKPERWISENGRIKYEPSSKFFAFNAGPRTCLGKQVAFTQLKTTAAAIVRNFDVEVIEGHCVAPSASIILHMKHGLMVRVTKRNYC